MAGFFSTNDMKLLSKPDGRTLSCNACGLYKNVLSPKMKPYGKFKKGIMNIGEAPGETEDLKGKHWQSKAGSLLKSTYAKLGIDLFEDCININAINCSPTDSNGNRTPSNFEIDCCRKIVLDAIKQYKPKVIILLGNSPLKSIIGYRWKESIEGIIKWRGWTIPDQDFKAWICPTLHPSYVMRMDNNHGIEVVWEQDLKRAFSKVNEPLPVFKEPEVVEITDLNILSEIPNYSTVAIDYETTGLKPHAKGHRIVSVSIAINEDKAYVFEMPKKAKDRAPFVNLLKNKYIKKIAQNMKYEHTWSKEILNTTVKNWWWDTMLMTHILDNRPGITGLKFQVYVQFGVIDYNSAVEKALKAPESNDLNTLPQFISKPKNREALLKYDGWDGVLTYRLAILQEKLLINSTLPF